jgi:flagellar basal body-associated protein FliL
MYFKKCSCTSERIKINPKVYNTMFMYFQKKREEEMKNNRGKSEIKNKTSKKYNE